MALSQIIWCSRQETYWNNSSEKQRTRIPHLQGFLQYLHLDGWEAGSISVGGMFQNSNICTKFET